MADISEDTLDDIKDRFDMFDKVGDKKVDSSQVINVLRACGLNPQTDDIENILEDSNLKGQRIDIETFVSIYVQIADEEARVGYEDMIEGLKTLDRDSTGTISGAELMQTLMFIGDKLSKEEADTIMSQHADSQGQVNYQTMVKTLMLSGK